MVLIIGENERDKIAEVIKHAEENIVSLDDIKKTMGGKVPPVGDDENFIVHLHLGHRIVYSIEEQKKGLVKHLSVSVRINSIYKTPTIHAVARIIEEFKFINNLKGCLIDKFVQENGQYQIHVWEPLDGNWNP